MRNYLFLILIFCFGKLSAQESSIEINDKAMDQLTFDLIQKNKFTYQKPEYWNSNSLYGVSTNEQKINLLLSNSRDKEILRLLDKAEKNKRREYFCFAALPLGIAAAYCIHGGAGSSALVKPIGAACLLASVSCVIISPIATKRKSVNYKKAVALYNAKF